jgi:hypothetical protein
MTYILIGLATVLGLFFCLALYFIVGITIQGKMTGGLTRSQAYKELFKEVFH